MIFFLALLAAVQEPSNADCDEQETQTEMNICASRAFATADHALNAEWKEVVATAKVLDDGMKGDDDGRPSHYSVLLDGQRAWLKYRDAQCASEGYWARGGSMEPMLIAACMERVTQARTKELKDWSKGLEQ